MLSPAVAEVAAVLRAAILKCEVLLLTSMGVAASRRFCGNAAGAIAAPPPARLFLSFF
jgi:hypothetical protein